MTGTNVTRRNLVKGAALGACAVAGLGATAALAGDATHTFADTVSWDAEYDVVVLGMGFAGMASAIAAADAGASVLICEKGADGQDGGNSRYCGQMFCYSTGTPEDAKTYHRALAAGRELPDDLLDAFAQGICSTTQIVTEKYGMSADDLMDCSVLPGLDVFTPEYPEFPCSGTFTVYATHKGVSDGYFYQSMKNRIANEYAGKIDVWFETPGTQLVQEPQTKTVIGVRVDRAGASRAVRALNGVCVCTGGYESNREMVESNLDIVNHAVIGGLLNTGDGIRMCQEAGARLWHMSVYEGGCGHLSCGYYTAEDEHAAQIVSLAPNSFYAGSTFIVGSWGRRFGDETYVCRHGHLPNGNGEWENPRYPEHVFKVWDQAQMDEIDAAGEFNEAYRDTLVTCADVAEAAAAIGCPEENLRATIEDFNRYAEAGADEAFGRSADTMRALEGDALYVLPLKPMILNTQGGPQRNGQAQVLDLDGSPIPHLYSAGEMGGITSCMYQGATNVAECFIFGNIAGTGAAQAKDALPAYEPAEVIESAPAHLGDETDLGPIEE